MISTDSVFPLNTTDFKDKVAVVTGGSRGIGKAIADRLIKEGARVVVGDILEKEGSESVEEYNKNASFKVAAFIRTDVTKYSDIKALFQLAETEFGGVDIAILNAGIASNADTIFSPLDDDLEEKIFKINSVGVIKGAKVAILHMAKRGGGSIVCTSSMSGLVCVPFLSAYNASKHAVVGFVRSCLLLPSVCNVRINAVCPGFVDTDIIPGIVKPDHPSVGMLQLNPRVPMDYVVEANMMLLSDETKNAQILKILPDGPEFSASSALPASMSNEVFLKAEEYYNENAISYAKNELADALSQYGI